MTGAAVFSSASLLPDALIARLVDKRVSDPDFPWRSAQLRRRRPVFAPDGKLCLLAADHPARRVTAAGSDPLAMADRRDFLARILRVLSSPRVDGVMATMDILEDLLTLDAFRRQAGAVPLLDGRLLIASLNRGGLAGAVWELDDPVTGPSCASCAAWRLDGAKMLLRVADDDPASLKTMLACAEQITEGHRFGLRLFVEPLPAVREGGSLRILKTPEALARLAGVATALGASSRNLWLKLPYCEGYERVARATTCPILLLGGETAGNAEPFLRQVHAALGAGPTVRGALAGRNVLYPGADDPLAAAEALGGVIHEGWTVEQALEAGRNRALRTRLAADWLERGGNP
jgi:hypothetical protein